MSAQTFDLTAQHVLLLSNLYVEPPTYSEWYAPQIDARRPFGNSEILTDVMRLLGMQQIETAGGEMVYTKQDGETARTVLNELPTALSVVLSAQSFEPGTYRNTADQYARPVWEAIHRG